MQTEIKEKNTKCLNWMMRILGVVLWLGLLAACLGKTDGYEEFHVDKAFLMNNVFHISWGSQECMMTLPGMIKNPDMESISISTVLHKQELGKGDGILLRNRQSRVKIYLDQKLLFDSGDAFDQPFPMGYGSFWKSVQLGDDYDGKRLTITLQPGYEMQAVSGYLPAIYFGSQASFLAMILRKVIWNLLLSMMLILLGIFYMADGLFAIHKKKAVEITFLGLFSVDTGLWLLIESHALELFVGNMQPVIYLSYFTYGMMPVLLVRFLLSHEEFADKIYLKMICLAGVVLNFTQFTLAAVQAYSLFESQWLNRVYLGFTVAGLSAALASVYKISKENGRRRFYNGIFILVVSTIMELIYFIFVNKTNSGRILIIGISLFILKSGVDVIREGKKLRRDDFEKEILQTMAYTDGMTRLGNRFAYELEKNRLEKSGNTHITLLLADMNGLKQANDNYGHSYGDQIICQTAEILEKSFENVGKCYRIGGDEFCVLAENADQLVFEKCMEQMEKEAAKLHDHIKGYGIASGVAGGDASELDDIFHQADSLMYACKKRMKAGK